MPTGLLTFFGRVPNSGRGYRATRYDFGDGLADEPVAFFGWPLQRRVRADRLVVLGTAGSMWDHLFEEGIASGAGGAAPAGSVYWFEDLQGPADKLAAWVDGGLWGDTVGPSTAGRGLQPGLVRHLDMKEAKDACKRSN